MKNRKSNSKEATIDLTHEPTSGDHNKNTRSAGLPPGWIRMTAVVKEEHIEKLRALAFWGQIPLKDVLDRILLEVFSTVTIDPIPKMGKDALDRLFERTFMKKTLRDEK